MRDVLYYEYSKPVLLKSSFEDIRNEFHDEKILLLFSPTKFINVEEDIINKFKSISNSIAVKEFDMDKPYVLFSIYAKEYEEILKCIEESSVVISFCIQKDNPELEEDDKNTTVIFSVSKQRNHSISSAKFKFKTSYILK